MATLAACASTSFTTATTWALVDSTSFSGSEAANNLLTTSYVASSTFTPGAITIDGIGLKLANRAVSPTGTITVALDLATADVAGTVVTINISDLPAVSTSLIDGSWIFFKFAAPVTLAGATAYGVKAKAANTNQATIFSTATTNWSRYLRTTTTGAPVAGDDLIIAQEWTAAATSTARTVTMDQTAATDYGSAPTAANGLVTPGIAICAGGTLTYGSTSTINYLLQLSNSLIVYNGGTLNIGTTGTPIPRDGSAVLQFDLAADGDYGLVARNGSTVNLQGLSRTIAKNVVSAKLTADTQSSTNLLQGLTTATTNGAVVANNALDPTGISRLASTFTDSAANNEHNTFYSPAATVPANTTQTVTGWLARGSGTNNRFVRVDCATSAGTNGFFADIDLQAGTIGACTSAGVGVATSSAIAALGTGFVYTIVGKASTATVVNFVSIRACSAAGTISYIGDGSQCFIFYGLEQYTAAALPSTTLSVDTDTGWLSGDAVAIASTTRTAAECEIVGLSSNAGASSFVSSKLVTNAHSGTTPTQAEVILLTRNVRVRSTNSTLMTYFQIKAGAVVDIDWSEFYYMGITTTGQSGVDVEVNTTAATNFTMNFSSVHDTEVAGFLFRVTAAGGTLTNAVFSSNTLFNLSSTNSSGCQISGAITSTNWTIDSNVMIRTALGNGWTLSDVGGTFTNNTVVGAASVGISAAEASTLGTFTGNVAHANVSHGFNYLTAGLSGNLTNFVGWRNGGAGIAFSNTMSDILIDTATLFGNTTDSVVSGTGQNGLVFKNLTANGDTSFATTNGLRLTVAGSTYGIVIDNGDFSTVSGIKTAHTNDISVTTNVNIGASVVLRNTKLGATVEVLTPSNLTSTGFIASEKHDQTAGNHMTWMKNGKVQTDTTIFNTASPSERMTPTSASLKLESAYQFQGKKVAVASGGTVTIAVYTRKSVVGDGTAYNGNQPRLILKANPAIGITTDTVIATASVAAGSWAQISGTTAAATDDGAMEFVVDCDGTTGWINVSDWSAA